jgi:DNA polymerase delta subunit 1
MHRVMEYCAHDADSCRSLWEKRNVLIEHFEIANLSFTPLSYAFYNANGIKVRNMVAYEANKSGYSMPMSYNSFNYRSKDIKAVEFYEKYPGAHVAKPKKGINCTPVIALDFESLYPSIIMAH